MKSPFTAESAGQQVGLDQRFVPTAPQLIKHRVMRVQKCRYHLGRNKHQSS